MCPACNGLGRKIGVDLDAFLDTSKSLNEGAILFPEYAVNNESAKRWIWGWNILTPNQACSIWTRNWLTTADEEMDLLLHSEP